MAWALLAVIWKADVALFLVMLGVLLAVPEVSGPEIWVAERVRRWPSRRRRSAQPNWPA